MKSIKIFSVCLAAVLGLTSCASSWLDQELTGSTLTQEEYNSMTNVATATVRGIYSNFYAVSDHDEFGIKSIDIATDLISSDLAMTADSYGWYSTDAQRVTSYRTSYIWSMYFNIIMNANAVLRSLDTKSTLTNEEADAYAQALTIRAYSYYTIANLYGPAAGDDQTKSNYGRHGAGADYDLAPIYSQKDTTSAGLVKEQPLSTYLQVREFVNSDLENAIEKFEQGGMGRESKLYFNIDMAHALLAYNCLQMGWACTDAVKNGIYQMAMEHANNVIESGNYQILPYENLTTTGFIDVTNASWMWGKDVTAENKGALASFWGHIDVYTYSYAYAGATKVCDDILFATIDSANDGRYAWFNTEETSKSYRYLPTGKFYSVSAKAKNPGPLPADDIDRDWLSDDVYMRVEEMYLVAAEAAYNLNNMTSAQGYLRALLEERYNNEAAIDAVCSKTGNDFLLELYKNWRVEMFAEGRALMTFKRFNQYGTSDFCQKKRGTNHFALTGEDETPTDYKILYIMPSSEATYNNEIND